MPGPRLPMRKIRDVLRLSAAGMSKRTIAASLGVSATAARDCIGRARRAGLVMCAGAQASGAPGGAVATKTQEGGSLSVAASEGSKRKSVEQ